MSIHKKPVRQYENLYINMWKSLCAHVIDAPAVEPHGVVAPTWTSINKDDISSNTITNDDNSSYTITNDDKRSATITNDW